MDTVGTTLLVTIIVVLTICFILSAVSGVSKGIQWLSNINMVLAGVLALVVFVGGPTMLILNLLPTAIGDYFGNLAQMAARTAATGGDATATWLAGWTVFYWAWWISWTPFVGMFIARISRGRTIRQFVAGVILIPSVVSLLWFAIFGGAAINLQRSGTDLASRPIEGQLFGLLDTMPLGAVLGVIAMLLVAIFFVSGADAASIVMGTLSQRGTIHPSRSVVVFWGAVMGAIAAIMLLVGGGEGDALSGIQNITIIMAAPFVVVMVADVRGADEGPARRPVGPPRAALDRGDRAGGRVRHANYGDALLRPGQTTSDRAAAQRGPGPDGGERRFSRRRSATAIALWPAAAPRRPPPRRSGAPGGTASERYETVGTPTQRRARTRGDLPRPAVRRPSMSTVPAAEKVHGGTGRPRRKHFLFSGEGWPYLLVPLIPVAVVLELVHAAPTWVFLASALGVIPTAALMGRATEELAARSGPGIGGFLNVTFGNAPELTIALFALGAGLHEVVKASLVG